MSDKVVTVTVTDFGSFRDDDEVVTLADLLAAISNVPEEHHATTVLAVEVFGDYASASLSLKYKRPETAAEFQKRERERIERDAASAREKYARAQREYLRLKQIFEP